jgi:hypothetical protein
MPPIELLERSNVAQIVIGTRKLQVPDNFHPNLNIWSNVVTDINNQLFQTVLDAVPDCKLALMGYRRKLS